jgi:hypothetical protein
LSNLSGSQAAIASGMCDMSTDTNGSADVGSAQQQAAVLNQSSGKRPRSEKPQNKEASRKGAELYQRISTWQGDPERTTLPLNTPGQPHL